MFLKNAVSVGKMLTGEDVEEEDDLGLVRMDDTDASTRAEQSASVAAEA
jgi:hypothetical protein